MIKNFLTFLLLSFPVFSCEIKDVDDLFYRILGRGIYIKDDATAAFKNFEIANRRLDFRDDPYISLNMKMKWSENLFSFERAKVKRWSAKINLLKEEDGIIKYYVTVANKDGKTKSFWMTQEELLAANPKISENSKHGFIYYKLDEPGYDLTSRYLPGYDKFRNAFNKGKFEDGEEFVSFWSPPYERYLKGRVTKVNNKDPKELSYQIELSEADAALVGQKETLVGPQGVARTKVDKYSKDIMEAEEKVNDLAIKGILEYQKKVLQRAVSRGFTNRGGAGFDDSFMTVMMDGQRIYARVTNIETNLSRFGGDTRGQRVVFFETIDGRKGSFWSTQMDDNNFLYSSDAAHNFTMKSQGQPFKSHAFSDSHGNNYSYNSSSGGSGSNYGQPPPTYEPPKTNASPPPPVVKINELRKKIQTLFPNAKENVRALPTDVLEKQFDSIVIKDNLGRELKFSFSDADFMGNQYAIHPSTDAFDILNRSYGLGVERPRDAVSLFKQSLKNEDFSLSNMSLAQKKEVLKFYKGIYRKLSSTIHPDLPNVQNSEFKDEINEQFQCVAAMYEQFSKLMTRVTK